MATLSVAATALAVGLMEIDLLKRLVDRAAFDKTATSFTLERLGEIQRRSLVVGLGWLLPAAVAVWQRRSLGHAARSAVRALPALCSELAGRIRRFVGVERLHAVLIVAFTLVLAISAARASGEAMLVDEAGTFYRLSRSWLFVLLDYTSPNNHILHTIMVKLSCQIFGDAPWAIRLPAILAGIFLVPATYTMLRIHANRSAALLSAAVVSSAPYMTFNATNSRGHTAVALLFVILLAIAPRLFASRSRGAWAAFVGLSAAGFFTVPTMLFPFVILIAWLLLGLRSSVRREDRVAFVVRLCLAVAATVLVVAALYSPAFAFSGLPFFGDDQMAQLGRATDIDPALGHQYTGLAQRLWRMWSYGQPAPVTYVLLAGFFLSPLFAPRISAFGNRLLIASLCSVLGLFFLLGLEPPKWTFVFLFPVYVAISAVGLVGLTGLTGNVGRRQGVAEGLVGGAAVLVVVANVCAARAGDVSRHEVLFGYEDAPQAARFLKEVLRPGDGLTCKGGYQHTIDYYLHRSGVSGYEFVEDESTVPTVYLIWTDEESAPQLRALEENGYTTEERIVTLPNSHILRLFKDAAEPPR